MTAVEVCPVCDIAGCRHIRERTTPADQLAVAMALPEVRALAAAADKVDDEYCAQEYGPTMHTIEGLRAALAPFGKATE